IAQDPSDIASRLAHSQFLLGRGRIEEALAAARAAANLLIATTRPARSLAVYSQLVACLLAAGRPSEAETERLHAENLGVESPYLAYLEGAVRSAEGKYAEAKDAFQAAGVGLPSFAEPLIGEALCTVRMGGPEALPAAIQSLESVAERDPLERHRALSGEAFVHHLAGRSQDAQILAREARNLAPDDPYVLYLLGRLLARAESWEEADEILEKNLERHPLLIEAMAEMAWLELQRAKHLPEGAYEFLEKGERFARKACQVEASRARLWVYQDLLGTIRYLLTDYEGARKAFQTSLDWGGGNHSKIMLALIKYRKGRVQNAVEDLQDLSEGIRDKTDPHKNFVLEVKRQIEDHLGKRLFKDSFQKPRFGKNWKVVSKHRKVKWRTGKGRAGVIGTSTDEKNELYLRYTLDRSGDFVSVEFDLEVGPAHRGSTAVMRISDRNARGSQSFELRVGFERGSRLYFREGRVATAKKPLFDMHDEDFPEDLRLKRGDEPITIKVELVRVPGKRSQGEVVVTFGGTELGRVPVKRWPAVDQRPTFFDFIVRGQRGSKLDAHLHGFRLIRKD
ncbi:MAG: tetratricopeptide repeat protein, partial [Planctomycetota bacterium]